MSQKSTPPSTTHIPNYLVFAILSTVFCCMPTGIVSIIHAAQVNAKIAEGNLAGAIEASKNAKMWAMISAGLGGFCIAIIFLYVVLVDGLSPATR